MLKRKFLQNFILMIFVGFLSSCVSVSSPTIQPQINNLVVAERYDYASKILEENRQSYGKQDELLYLLDAGMLAHLTKKYAQSIQYFEEAKRKYDQLYTVSLTNQASTWLINDKKASYRGEDFERVMINFFQAVNFVMLGQVEEALVEARNADRVLNAINAQYNEKQKNKYREDGAIRLFMGILYETLGTAEGNEEAYISYKKSLDAYESDFFQNSSLGIPQILKANLLRMSKANDPEGFAIYKQKFSDIEEVSLSNQNDLADVYLIFYGGLSPIKHQFSLPIPLPNGFVGKLAFPQYEKRDYVNQVGIFKAVSSEGQEKDVALEIIEDIGYLAHASLEDRKTRVISKALLRSAGKFIVEDISENMIHENYGDNAGTVFRYLASLYNIASEEADLRSWQTLPGQIKIARLNLKPGQYSFWYQDKKIAEFDVKGGEKKFCIYRSTDE